MCMLSRYSDDPLVTHAPFAIPFAPAPRELFPDLWISLVKCLFCALCPC